MYKVYFYKDRSGKAPVEEYLTRLAAKKDKDSRINLNKIREYIKTLSEYGTRVGEPYVKHIKGKIWELRPLQNRILFFGYDENKYILLSHFIKQTRKTPPREIDKANRLMKDYLERSKEDEKK